MTADVERPAMYADATLDNAISAQLREALAQSGDGNCPQMVETYCVPLYTKAAAPDAMQAELREMRRAMAGEFRRAQQLAAALEALLDKLRGTGEAPLERLHARRLLRGQEAGLHD